MNEIIAATESIAPYLTQVQFKQLRHIILAMLCMTGRVTMLGLSRWTEGGGSYRTVQRWFHSRVDWGMVLWMSVKGRLSKGKVYMLAGDDVVVGKAGKKTHGLGRFYSSIAQRAIPGLSFFVLSVLDVEKRQSHPIRVEQHLPSPKQPAAEKPKRGRGRPKGSRSYSKAPPVLSAELQRIGKVLASVGTWAAGFNMRHVVLDGFFGNGPSAWVVQQQGFHLISKLRHNAALFWPYTGHKPKRGATPRYGDRVDYAHLPLDKRCSSLTEHAICTDTYQLTVCNKQFAHPLNVVILLKTHLKSNKQAHVMLFSTDLSLSAAQMVDYYSLRFQIEFNFRDAKQYWGLEDFMTLTAQAVTNAVNLAFLMVNLSSALLHPYRQRHTDFSVLDLKALFRARRYLRETIKLLPDSPTPDFISRLWRSVSRCVGSLRPLHLHHLAA